MSSLQETSLQEIYGDNYANDFVEHNRRYVADLIISNIAGLNFSEVKHDYQSLFGKSPTLPDKWFDHIKRNVEKMNPSLVVLKITNPETQVPRLVNEPQVSYFHVVDLHRKKSYILILTPYIMDAF